MQNALAQELSRQVAELREVVRTCSTTSVAGWCFTYTLGNDTPSFEGLTSPYKQLCFLLGVLLETPEPETPKDFTRDEWLVAKELLERLFAAYMQLFIPTEGELGKQTEQWRRVREVAMPAFLSSYSTGLMASVEQVADRVEAYVEPHDAEVERLLGIRASDSLRICKSISKQMQGVLDSLVDSAEKARHRWDVLMDKARHQRLS